MEIGDKVEHILSKDWLLVLDRYRDEDTEELKYICRTKSLEVKILNEFELRPVRR